MKDKIDSMASNQVWNLVKFPNSVKSIGDSQGNNIRHKEKLVAKGFTKREGIDYIETFCLNSRSWELYFHYLTSRNCYPLTKLA
ncbi:hypothetical protein CR513_15812, partial [Mucuna pruriens]